MKLDQVLKKVTRLIVGTWDPERVVLFGSCAKGQANRDSDLDILVIGEFRNPPCARDREAREMFDRLPIRVDLHLLTPHEAEAAAAQGLNFISSALATGRLLYDRTAAADLDPLPRR